EALGLARLDDPVRGQDEHLRRDAADVEAGAAEPALLDDRDVETFELWGDEGVARPGADDDQVVVRRHAGSVCRPLTSPSRGPVRPSRVGGRSSTPWTSR